MSGPDRIWADSRGASLGGNWGAEGCFCQLTGGTEYIRRDPAVLAALPEVQALILESCDRFRRNLRETFDAMCAMRDTINEHMPMPSLESDLLQGPENSVFCATVAKSVIGAIAARDAMIAAERDACIAECQRRVAKHEGDGRHEMMREAELCGDAIRKRGNV